MKTLQLNNITHVTFSKQFAFQKSGFVMSMLGAFCIAAFTTTTNIANAKENKAKWVAGQILVKPAPGLTEDKLTHILSARGGKNVGKLQRIGVHIVSVPPQAEQKVIAALSRNPNIEFAELDMLVPLNTTMPSDPGYSRQWHLPQINSPTAWDINTGNGITVAIIDTGVNPNHSDLKARLVSGYNTVDNNTVTSDIHGHGTAVAGTVAATANNGTGIAAVAWNSNLMPIRVSNRSDGIAQWSDLAEAVTWAADHGAKVANISYAISNSSVITSAAAYMKSKGGIVVSSAGNSGTDLGFGDNPHIITVSATEQSDAITSWSSYGNMVDIIAPGTHIYTTNNSGSYSSWSGTSFSSPVVAGVAALVMSTNPALTADEVEQILESTAKDLGIAGWDKKYGHGRVDAGAAVLAASNLQQGTIKIPVEDTLAPTVDMNLSNNSLVSGTQIINVTAEDPSGISSVELFLDGSAFATDSIAPYNFSWDTMRETNGASIVVTATATDNAGNSASVARVVTVNNPQVVEDVEAPRVAIVSPADGSIVSGTEKIVINGSDNTGISLLSCYVDGNLLAATNDANNMTCSWNTRKENSGSHSIMAKAEDANGNVSSVIHTVIIETSGNLRGTSNNRKGRKK